MENHEKPFVPNVGSRQAAVINDEEDNALAKAEREHKKEIVQTEREYSKTLIKAAATLAEYNTKVKLISRFQKGASDYAGKILHYNKEISDLKANISHVRAALDPSLTKINTLKSEIDKLLFLYKDRNAFFDKLIGEIENLMFEYSTKIESKELFDIVADKKRALSNLCEEIERLEREALKKEQEKLTREKEIQRQLDDLTGMELELSFLKNKKSKEEIAGLFSMVGKSLTQIDGNAEKNINFDNRFVKKVNERRVIEADSIKIERSNSDN